MKPGTQDLGYRLREGTHNFMNQRRIAASLTLLGMTSLGVIALYQLGILKNLPEPSLRILNAEKVNGSATAYCILNTPDAVLGLGSYAATLGLTAMGAGNRAEAQPWVPLALAAKASLDTWQALKLTRASWVNYRAFSLYSLVTVITTLLTLPSVMPEAWAARRKIIDIFC